MSVLRTLRTIRHLKATQVVAQVRHQLAGAPRPPDVASEQVKWAVERWPVTPLPPAAHAVWDGAGRIELVGEAVPFGSRDAIDFAYAQAGPLWAYQLHFFDWARSPVATREDRAAVLAQWLRRPPSTPGWDPHPISMRTLSWLKLRLAGELPDGFPGSDADAALRASLARQIDWLSRHVEVRLQANHLLDNWIAVVAGGLALSAPQARDWLDAWEPLARQLEEQIGPDGAHYERSPMYHALLLEHLLDLLALTRAAPDRAPGSLVSVLEEVCARMLGALWVWTHPDGEIALFGDSAFDVAHPPEALERYAASLGVTAQPPAEVGLLRSAGFARLETDDLCWLGSVGGPSPAYQPGHAHCDALSFELSAEGQRVVTDTGVYEYVSGDRRDQARRTRAHATLEVGGQDQAEIWSAHRVGGRPRVTLHEWLPGVAIEGRCASWSSRGTVHRRRVEVDGEALVVTDALEGPPRAVRAALPLAPGCEPALSGPRAEIRLRTGAALRVELPAGLDWRLEDAPYFPRFGCEVRRPVLVGTAARFAQGVWRFRLVR